MNNITISFYAKIIKNTRQIDWVEVDFLKEESDSRYTYSHIIPTHSFLQPKKLYCFLYIFSIQEIVIQNRINIHESSEWFIYAMWNLGTINMC